MAKIYGALEVAQVEWFTQSPDTRPAAASNIYRVIYASDVKQIQVSDGTTWRTSHVTTYTSGTIPAASANTYQLIWVSDLQQLQVSNGTSWVLVGSKAGTKNYFSQNNANADFETNSTTPWSACTLTFSGNAPTGAPTLSATQMTLSVSSSDPLAGAYSMLLTKAAANAQYQGFISGTLTIDREDTAKVLYGSFAYEVVSGTVDFSGTSTQTYEIWIYNTVSGAWTQPAGYRGMNQSSGPGKVVFSFQTDGATANNAYKVAVITQQTGTSAAVVKFDDFQIGPSAIVTGAVVTDWESYTPTTQGLGTIASVAMYWRRVGANVEIMGNLTTGTITASEAQIGLPGGVTSNSNISTIQMAGTVLLGATTSAYRNLLIETSKTYMTVGLTTTGGQLVKQNGTTFANSSVLSFQASIPVQGWSSTVQMSNDTDTRVVCANVNTSTSSIATTDSLVTFTNIVNDTHGAYSTSTGLFTVPVSGYYKVTSYLTISALTLTTGQTFASVLYRNGSLAKPLSVTHGNGASNAYRTFGSAVVLCNAGDTLAVYASNGNTTTALTSATVTNNNVTFERISGPSVIAANETVAASYWATANISTSVGSQFNFAGKEYDTHSAVTTGASWKFTAPISGIYNVTAQMNPATTPAGSNYFNVWKNGSFFANAGWGNPGDAIVASLSLMLNAGDYIDLRPGVNTFNMSGNATRSTSGVCAIQIERKGTQ